VTTGNWTLKPLILILLSAIVLCGCDEEIDPPAPPPASEAYPVDITLEDAQGRKLSVTVIGRTSSHLTFTKQGSSQTFEYPISKLSMKDQGYVLQLPVADGKRLNLEKDQLRRVEARITDIQAEIEKSPNAQMRVRTLEKQLMKLKDERKALKAKLRQR
jgi:hypothetical protein